MTDKPHLPLATNKPPTDIVSDAKVLAASQRGPVYVYQYSGG
ncbi:MAG: hypothetical protein ACI89S_002876, partial [Gammaproteobacteria bacterium]